MGSDERHTDSSYKPATSFASDCPDLPIRFHLCITDPCKCGGTGLVPGVDPLYCRCGVLLAPHEVRLDLGDGDELLCDACLGLSN